MPESGKVPVQTYVEAGSGEPPIESENLVEFRLLYSGILLGSGKNDTRAKHKHELRRQFHPQLRRLWQCNTQLRHLARFHAPLVTGRYPPARPEDVLPVSLGMTPEQAEKHFAAQGLEAIGKQWERLGYRFVPLVTFDLCLRCSIDVLFLRPEESRFIMQGGDLDARIKTVFDALRLPDSLDEAGGIGPQQDEEPFFCLLQDDKLISEIKVNTDELLVLPKEREVKANDAFLVIHVKLNPARPSQYGELFD